MKYCAAAFFLISCMILAEDVVIVDGLPFSKTGEPVLDLQILFEEAMKRKYGADFRQKISYSDIFNEMIEMERLVADPVMAHIFEAQRLKKEHSFDYTTMTGVFTAGITGGILASYWLFSAYDEEYPPREEAEQKLPYLIQKNDITLAVGSTRIFVFNRDKLVVLDYDGKGLFNKVWLSKDATHIFALADGGFRAWHIDGSLVVAMNDLENGDRSIPSWNDYTGDDDFDGVPLTTSERSQWFLAKTGDVVLDFRSPSRRPLVHLYRCKNGDFIGNDGFESHHFKGQNGQVLSSTPINDKIGIGLLKQIHYVSKTTNWRQLLAKIPKI